MADSNTVWGVLTAMADNDRLPTSVTDLKNNSPVSQWPEELIIKCLDDLVSRDAIDMEDGKIVSVYWEENGEKV